MRLPGQTSCAAPGLSRRPACALAGAERGEIPGAISLRRGGPMVPVPCTAPGCWHGASGVRTKLMLWKAQRGVAGDGDHPSCLVEWARSVVPVRARRGCLPLPLLPPPAPSAPHLGCGLLPDLLCWESHRSLPKHIALPLLGAASSSCSQPGASSSCFPPPRGREVLP